MSEFSQKTGVMAIGSRLRILNERLSKDTEKIFDLYNVDIKAKWYPVLFSLLEDEKKTVTTISKEVGQSHVSILKLVKEMSKVGLIEEQRDKNDARKVNLSLSEKAKEIAIGLKYQHKDTTLAIEKMLEDTTHNLWLALDEFEALLDEKSTFPRVKEEKKKRESLCIQIVDYEDKYSLFFKELNEEWLKKYFVLEEKDIYCLNNPKESILDKGGKIFIALYEGKVAGVCSLLKYKDDQYDFELSKMAVSDDFKEKGIGYLLLKHSINYVKNIGKNSIFLETSTLLNPAINLYKKFGFKRVTTIASSYERSNYQMELIIN